MVKLMRIERMVQAARRRMYRAFRGAVGALAVGIAGSMAFASCSPDAMTSPPGTVTLVGDSVFIGRSMRATFTPADSVLARMGPSASDSVRWTSSDTSVVLVDSTGLVAAVGVGTATVSVRYRGRTAQSGSIRAVPRYADGGVSFVRLSRGMDRHCAISTEAAVYCVAAQPPATDSLFTFQRMPGAAGLRFTEVHTAFQSVCGLLSDGRIACWGRQDWDLDTRTPPNPTPIPVVPTDTGPGIVPTPRRFRTMSYGGHAAACAIDVTDNQTYCWGHNDWGQLGRGTRTNRENTMAPRLDTQPARMVSTSHFLTCVVGEDRRGACSGWGYGSGTGDILPTPRVLLGNVAFDSIRAGYDASCGISTDRELYCWGPNQSGELGDGTNVDRLTPTRVAGGLKWNMVSAPYNAACGVATDGEARCWGASGHAMLRVNSMLQPIPTRVARGIRVNEVSFAVLARVCLVTNGGRIVCT